MIMTEEQFGVCGVSMATHLGAQGMCFGNSQPVPLLLEVGRWVSTRKSEDRGSVSVYCL